MTTKRYTSAEQLKLWLEGQSVHATIRKRGGRNEEECCPDFSCCYPELLADRTIRERYCISVATKDQGTQFTMLKAFLEKFLQKAGFEIV